MNAVSVGFAPDLQQRLIDLTPPGKRKNQAYR